MVVLVVVVGVVLVVSKNVSGVVREIVCAMDRRRVWWRRSDDI